MGYRQVQGMGSVWEEDYKYHDKVGHFEWELTVKQADSRLFVRLSDVPIGRGDSYYDGRFAFTTDVQMASVNWPCKTGQIGMLVTVACVSNVPGANSQWSIWVPMAKKPIPTLQYSPGYKGQKMEWRCDLLVCPGEDGCPKIDVLKHTATVSDPEYFWGDSVIRTEKESANVYEQKPQVIIGGCDRQIDYFTSPSIPQSVWHPDHDDIAQ